MLLRAVFFLIFSNAPFGSASAVQKCFACAGDKSLCVNNNRTDFLEMDCTNFLVENQSFIARTEKLDILEKFDSEVGLAGGNNIGCLSISYVQNGTEEKAIKSCVPDRVFEADICEYFESLVDLVGGKTSECHFCKSDNCNFGNPSGSIAFYVLPLFVLFTFLINY